MMPPCPNERRHRLRSSALTAVLASCCAAGCAPTETRDPNAISIGLLLPYTGDQAATGSNFEEAVLYVRDRVNNAGGLKGHPLAIVEADTHSDPKRAVQSAQDLIHSHVVAVLGPESADIAAAIKPLLDQSGTVFLSPFVGADNDDTVDCSTPWFRLAPSAATLGQALAKQLIADNQMSISLLHETDAYNTSLAAALVTDFKSFGGHVALDSAVSSSAQGYDVPVSDVIAAAADAVVLATSPRTAALLANEVSSQHSVHWYLSPLLKTDVLVENVAPEALEGAVGVTPDIFDRQPDFSQAFSTYWQGDAPLDGAYFYSDAMGLLAFALEWTLVNRTLNAANLQEGIMTVAEPTGQPTGWNDIETGISELGRGSRIVYAGLTGPMLLALCGDRRNGQSSTWTIHSGTIKSQ